MKHRHKGYYRSKTSRGRITYKRRPLHPKTGSWLGKEYIHGPRQKQPNEFKRMYTVSQAWARKRHLHISPPDKDAKVVVGTLKKNNRLAVQSYLTPSSKYKDSSFKELQRKFRISKMRDDDKDRVPNYRDCRPFDRRIK